FFLREAEHHARIQRRRRKNGTEESAHVRIDVKFLCRTRTLHRRLRLAPRPALRNVLLAGGAAPAWPWSCAIVAEESPNTPGHGNAEHRTLAEIDAEIVVVPIGDRAGAVGHVG